MWLIVRDSDNAVIGTNYTISPTVSVGITVREWHGAEPPIHDPENGVYSYDPTLDDPDYPDFQQRRIDFDALKIQATNEIEWLNDNIPLVSSADLATLRSYLERIMREQRQEMRAWRYIFSRLS